VLQALLDQVKNAIFNDPMTPHRTGYDPSGLIGHIEGLFGQHQQQAGPNGPANVRPASEDPYGDPADQFGNAVGAGAGYPANVRPASEDPLGDPANQGGGSYGYLDGQNVRPASEDPLGDPADQEGTRR
jgi:hypothetical protein